MTEEKEKLGRDSLTTMKADVFIVGRSFKPLPICRWKSKLGALAWLRVSDLSVGEKLCAPAWLAGGRRWGMCGAGACECAQSQSPDAHTQSLICSVQTYSFGLGEVQVPPCAPPPPMTGYMGTWQVRFRIPSTSKPRANLPRHGPRLGVNNTQHGLEGALDWGREQFHAA